MKLLLLCSSLFGFCSLALPSDQNTQLAMKQMIERLIGELEKKKAEAEKKDREILRFKTAITGLDRQRKRELEEQENEHMEYLQNYVIGTENKYRELEDKHRNLENKLKKTQWKHDRMNELTTRSIQSQIYHFPRSFKKTDISVRCLK